MLMKQAWFAPQAQSASPTAAGRAFVRGVQAFVSAMCVPACMQLFNGSLYTDVMSDCVVL